MNEPKPEKENTPATGKGVEMSSSVKEKPFTDSVAESERSVTTDGQTFGSEPESNANGPRKVVPFRNSGGGQGGSTATGKPIVLANHRQLPEITADAVRALEKANRAIPKLFTQNQGTIVQRITRSDDGSVRLKTLDSDGMKGEMARVATWMTMTEKGTMKDVFPPNEVVKDFLSLPQIPLPALDRVVTAPVFVMNSRTGKAELVTKDGYHPDHKLYVAKTADLVAMPNVSMVPTAGEVAEAKRWILDELLFDFPFEHAAGKVHAVAYMMLVFVQGLIEGPTPIHLVDAPEAGSGKGLLNDGIGIVESHEFWPQVRGVFSNLLATFSS